MNSRHIGLPKRCSMVHPFGLGMWVLAGELKEASKVLTAFMVGSLGFHECEQMPFGLMNTPVTFQVPYGDLFGQPAIPVVYHLST